jgi:hypothetical protein
VNKAPAPVLLVLLPEALVERAIAPQVDPETLPLIGLTIVLSHVATALLNSRQLQSSRLALSLNQNPINLRVSFFKESVGSSFLKLQRHRVAPGLFLTFGL